VQTTSVDVGLKLMCEILQWLIVTVVSSMAMAAHGLYQYVLLIAMVLDGASRFCLHEDAF
jgi:hypothetical protein